MRNQNRVAAGLVLLMLAGCAHAPMPTAAVASSTQTRAMALDGAGRANQLAALVKGEFKGTVAVKGAVVTLTSTAGDKVTYDFGATARTGMVAVTSGDATTSVSSDKVVESASGNDKFLPVVIVPIAIDVAFGGAKALALYWITHRHDFNRDDAIKACVIGMTEALLDFVPYGQYFKWLVPIAADIIAQVKVGDIKEITAIALKEVDKLVEIIKQILHDQPQASVAAAG